MCCLLVNRDYLCTTTSSTLCRAVSTTRARVTRRYHHAVRSGVRIAVTITDAVTCTVAAAATGAKEVSASATACGTAAEFPAVLDAAAPAIPEPPSNRSIAMHTAPVTISTVTPRATPGRPAVTTDFRLIV